MGVLSVIRDIDDVARQVGKTDPAVVISCNNCVRACGTGGEMHLDRICGELAQRGVRVEETLLITNPCSRGYLESYDLSNAVRKAVVLACAGTQAGLEALHPDIEVIAGVDTVGLMISSKATGRLKVIATFPGHEEQMGKEFQLGDTSVRFDDEVLTMGGHGAEEVQL